jgi:transcription initiation factor TFIIE subunit alpha
MRISSKIIEGVVTEVAGEDTLPLVKYLKDKKNISEFKIAESLKEEVNFTRNMLYRLYHNNLVSFIRKKDKKKGWYIYYWTFNPKTVGHLFGTLRKKRLENLRERLKREQSGQFFICPERCMRLDFEQATNFEFKCVECSQLLSLDENTEVIGKIQSEIDELEAAKALADKELADKELEESDEEVEVIVKKKSPTKKKKSSKPKKSKSVKKKVKTVKKVKAKKKK